MSAKPPTSAPPADLRLGPDARNYLRAVVFDSNAFGHGRPDLTYLEDLARLLYTIGIETWVPEPVAWEWAQHLAADWQRIDTGMADERRRLRHARLTRHSSPYQDASAVIDAFLAGLTAVPHLTVISLSPEHALLALKDQVLLIPPGRLKGEVKTGASDSAWLRAALEKVEGDTGRLLIVSEDQDIKAAFGQWKNTCPLMRRRSQLRATLSEFTVDEGRAENLIRQYLTTLLGDSSRSEGLLGFDIDASNLERLITSDLAADEPDTALHVASLTRVTGLAGITGTYVESAPAAEADEPRARELEPAPQQTALARVFFLADAQATVNRLYSGGDPQVDDLDYDGVLVRMPMSFDIQNGRVIAGRTEDEANISLPDDEYVDPDDAAADILDALGAVPGLTPFEVWPEDDVVLVLVAGANKTPVQLEISDPHGDWRLNATIGTDTAELSCTYDDSAVVITREETLYIRPPYQVRFDSEDLDSFNPIWALNQWIINRT